MRNSGLSPEAAGESESVVRTDLDAQVKIKRPYPLVAIIWAAAAYAVWTIVADGAFLTGATILVLCNRIGWAIDRIAATTPPGPRTGPQASRVLTAPST